MSQCVPQNAPTTKAIETELATMSRHPRTARGPALVVEATTES